MEQKILLFRSITQDQDINKTQIVKFVNWGKGDIQQALNYYYKHLEKGKIKRTLKSKPSDQIPKSQQISMKSRISIKKQVQIQQEAPILRESQVSISSSEQQFTINSNNAFDVLKKGSVQHKKTHDFIKHVRQIYKLPINGKPQKQLIKASKSSLSENTERIPKQFHMADCLSKAFDSQYVSQAFDKNTPDTIGLHQQNRDHENSQSRMNLSNKIIDISISQQGQDENADQQQQSFKDISHYQYKHVYTSSSSKKKQQEKKAFIQNLQKINKEDKLNNLQIKETKDKREKESVTKNKITLERQMPLKNQIKKKQTKLSKNMNKQQLLAQEYQLNKIKATKSVRNAEQSQKNKLQSQSQSQNSISKKNTQILQEDQILMGEYFVRALCTERRRYQPQCHGQPVGIQTFIEQIKVKKKNFGRKGERNMNMRITFQGRQIGRIADEQVRIIMPLIDQELIRIQFFIQDVPIIADLLKPMTLKARVFFLNKLITEPIIETFQPKQQDKQRVDQLSALLSKLNLPIITPPLIKAKSKYIKPDKSKKKKQSTFDINRFGKTIQEQQKIKQQREQKNKIQLQRYRNDPNYKQKQQNLKQIIQRNQQNLKLTPNKRNQIQYVQQEGQVKKKIIEIDSQAQKSKLTQLIQLHDQNYQPYYPQHNFVSNLYHYQALALAWMLRRQGFLSADEDKQQLHPLWTEYEVPATQKYHMYFNQLTGQICVKRPTAVIKCKGGILADEMGLGKTVMMTALIVSNPPHVQARPSQQGGTLVIVPLTLLSQWQSQINKHTTNQKVITYYSNQRKKIVNSLHKYDVVISTYGTVSHQYAQGLHTKKQGIYKYKWHRIILDEAHYIKGRIIQTSKATYQLSSAYRWCLTGTPIQNQVTDIFSLLHFIKYTPWSQYACWNRFIVKPLQEQDQTIYQVLRTILKQVFLRRTKMSQGANGKPIIQLPPRISKVELLTMSQKQRKYYDQIYNSSRTDFDKLIQQGILQAKYMQVLQMLMRLRQICCHPILFKSVSKFAQNNQQFQAQLKKLIKKSQKKRVALEANSQSQDQYYEPIIDQDYEQIRVKANSTVVSEQYMKQILEKVANQNLDNCIICLNQPQDPVITCCLHIFCKACNIRQIEQKGTCSFCRRPIAKDDCIHLPRQNRLNIKKGTQQQKDLFPSTKMIALNQHLHKLKQDDKAVVFSQFLGMLDLLENQLIKNNIKYVRMQGSNTHKQRTKIVKSFQQDPTIQVFLVSLKTAGVGLNLVAANKVFLMDPWWNPAVQEQAIERVHRIGQKRQVQIFRFIMDRTIQTRMLQLNTQKKALSQNVLNQNQDKDTNANNKIQKLRYLMEHY